MLDRLDSLVPILPDVPNRSRLVEHFLEMQIALLLNPEVSWSAVMLKVLDLITDEAMAEIETWKVPDQGAETHAAGNA